MDDLRGSMNEQHDIRA